MATKDTPVFTQKQATAGAVCTAAKTTYNDLTNAVLLHTAGADGALVKRIWAFPRANVTATNLQLYLVKASAPTVAYLIDSETMGAQNPLATAGITSTDFKKSTKDTPVRLAPGDMLYVGIGVALAGGIVFVCEPEEFS